MISARPVTFTKGNGDIKVKGRCWWLRRRTVYRRGRLELV